MSYLCRTLSQSVLLLATGVALGCTTTVAPIPPSEIMMTEEMDGVLFGTIHLTGNGKDRSVGFNGPTAMKWWIEEETRGRRMLLTRLPLNGPFVVKLPPGSYRVLDVSFQSSRGVWHAAFQPTFRIRSQACTSLGAWDLEMQTGFQSGRMTMQVSNVHAPAHENVGRILEAQGCLIVDTVIESDAQHSVTLKLRPRGADRY